MNMNQYGNSNMRTKKQPSMLIGFVLMGGFAYFHISNGGELPIISNLLNAISPEHKEQLAEYMPEKEVKKEIDYSVYTRALVLNNAKAYQKPGGRVFSSVEKGDDFSVVDFSEDKAMVKVRANGLYIWLAASNLELR